MSKSRIILDQLKSRKRVNITSQNYLLLVKTLLTISYGVIVVLNVVNFYIQGVDYTSLSVCALSLALSGFVFQKIIKHTSTTAVIGDTLIMNNDKRKHCVTSLRSIKGIKTFSFLLFEVTRLTYNIDGKTSYILIVSKSQAFEVSPEGLLRTAMELSKKQKANHKPGPVAA